MVHVFLAKKKSNYFARNFYLFFIPCILKYIHGNSRTLFQSQIFTQCQPISTELLLHFNLLSNFFFFSWHFTGKYFPIIIFRFWCRIPGSLAFFFYVGRNFLTWFIKTNFCLFYFHWSSFFPSGFFHVA